ncbi:hypothetical protein A2W14_02430 [Candidatus Gottesmanbacteria bacterium RBG_16_37_8]|uniref:Uncharacterized protein n=1 Tax=Candidatus Gottesmanbacteria bacterium RBG_16_37_8 TaxID=1798371 RepID=A0A1F5YT87_9BACT|nr:MAG: hypothetical protein A2W14_02430 [Candidatus Gottesmanbacteria bacterium RBG_16_37_8]
MEDKNQNQEFKLLTDKSFMVATFLAVVMFVVLLTVARIVNRNEQYTQTESKAGNKVMIEETAADISGLDREVTSLQKELQQESENELEPDLNIDLELEE